MTLWRISLTVIAVVSLTIAFVQIRLWFQCPQQLEIEATALAGLTSPKPVWAKVEKLVAPARPFVIASETGRTRGAYLALASPSAPDVAVAILYSDVHAHVRKVHAGEAPFGIEGLASVPPKETSGLVDDYLSRNGLRRAAGLRIIEIDWRPLGLARLGTLFLAAALSTTLLVLSFTGLKARLLSRIRRRFPLPIKEGSGQLPSFFSPRVVETSSTSLPDEVKVRLRRMVTEVWQEVATATAAK